MLLSEAQRNSFQGKYNLILAQEIQLTRENCKEIFLSNFSLSEEEGDLVVEKAFEISQNKQELDREGFFMGLKCIQALQNQVDISEVSTQRIYDTLYVKKLQVRRKKDDKNNMVYMENTLIFDNGFQENYEEMNQLHLNSHEGGLNIGSSFHERMSQGNDVLDSSQIIDNLQGYGQQKNADKSVYQSVKIINVKQGKDGLIWYNVETVYMDKASIVSRRFNDFEMLNTYILRNYGGEIVPKLPEKESISAFYNRFLGDISSFTMKRRQGLQEFLRKVLDLKQIAQDKDEVVKKFLLEDDLFVEILKKVKTKSQAGIVLQTPIVAQQVLFDDDEDPIPDPISFNMSVRITNLISKHKNLDQWILYIKDYDSSGNRFSFEYEATLNYLADLKNRYQDILQFEGNLKKYQIIPLYQPNQTDLTRRRIIQQNHSDLIIKVLGAIKSFDFDRIYSQLKDKLLRLEDIFYTVDQWRRIINQWTIEKRRLDADTTNTCDIQNSKQRNLRHEEKININLAQLNQNIEQEIKNFKNFKDNVLDSLLICFKE